jgi:hypothetical protein
VRGAPAPDGPLDLQEGEARLFDELSSGVSQLNSLMIAHEEQESS